MQFLIRKEVIKLVAKTEYEEALKAIMNVFEQDDMSTEDVIANLQSLADEIEQLIQTLQ